MATTRSRKTPEAGAAEAPSGHLTIPAPRFRVATFTIEGTAPYVQNRFSAKALAEIRATQEGGSQAKKGRKREPKNFDEIYRGAVHRAAEGWIGIPAPAFRAAMISACRIVGFFKTMARLSVFVEGDGLDAVDGTPLVRITAGEPSCVEHYVRNQTGVVDLRPRPMWAPGWRADVRVRWDLDQFSLEDTTNLLTRAGLQVGIGEGRPDSRNSAGMGWGLFQVVSVREGGQ